jgi:hypothetical protein
VQDDEEGDHRDDTSDDHQRQAIPGTFRRRVLVMDGMAGQGHLFGSFQTRSIAVLHNW